MTKYATFSNEGFATGFYDDLSNIPEGAIEITEDQWSELVEFQGLRRWINGNVTKYTPPEPTPEEKRERMPSLTARQIRLGLLHLGKLSAVDAAIGALPEPDKSEALIEWDYAGEFHRLNDLIVKLIPILGLIDEDVDLVWEHYSTI